MTRPLATLVSDRRRLRDRVRLHPLDPGAVGQHSLDDRLLGRVMEAAHVQDRGGAAALAVAVAAVAMVLARAHRYLVFAKRSTAAISLFSVALFASPDAIASWPQRETWFSRISNLRVPEPFPNERMSPERPAEQRLASPPAEGRPCTLRPRVEPRSPLSYEPDRI